MDAYAITSEGMRNMATGEVVPRDDAPAPPATMLVGAHINPTNLTEWNRLETLMGHQMGVVRSFSSGLPTTWASTSAAWHPAHVTSWHSMKADWAQVTAGTLDTQITNFVASIPAERKAMLTFAHEPENDGGVASQWRTAQARFYDLVKSVRPDIPVGPILMSWTFAPASGRNPADWTPPTGKCDFFGLDAYNTYMLPIFGSPTGWDYAPLPEMNSFINLCETLGVPPALGEFGSAEHATDPTMKATWMHAMVDFMDAHDGLACCWFNTNKPNDTTESILMDSSPQSIAAWSEILADHPIPA